MDSFEDISSFADEAAADESANDNDPANEGFSEFKLTNLKGGLKPAADPDVPLDPPGGTQSTHIPTRATEGGGEDTEPWSHQDLSRFKIELPPVSVESEEFSLSFDLSEVETGIQNSEFLLNHATKTPTTATTSQNPDDDGAIEIPLSIETPLTLDSNPSISQTTSPKTAFTDFSNSVIPQLEADRLEEIIRAQSREIIESVVRRIVPDIASELIKQEIQRLLEDTSLSSVHESLDRETRR